MKAAVARIVLGAVMHRLHRLRRLRRVAVVAALGVGALALVSQDACVLAEPSSDLPRLPESRPTILHALVVPSTTQVLTRFPTTFIVPVELTDRTSTIYYAAFIDYNPFTGVGLVDGPFPNTFEADNGLTTGRTRTLNVAIPAPADLDQCHRIEVVVALRLKSTTDSKNAHTPDAPGGDIVTWFYNPNGDLGGCPSLDAGIDASFGGDAGEGGAP
jgi:hypothetical protein